MHKSVFGDGVRKPACDRSFFDQSAVGKDNLQSTEVKDVSQSTDVKDASRVSKFRDRSTLSL